MNIRRFNRVLFMWQRLYDDEIYNAFLFKLKKRKEKNVTKNQNHEYKISAERMQDDDDHNIHDINDRSVKLISNDEIIKEEEQFSLVKFSHEKILST